jgi:hypothetical protein
MSFIYFVYYYQVTMSRRFNYQIQSGSANLTTGTFGTLLTTDFKTTNISTSSLINSSFASIGSLNTGNVTTGNINFTGTLSQNGAPYIGSQWVGTTGTITFGTSGSSLVGINTTSPAFTLDVSGGARIVTGITTASILATTSVSSAALMGTNSTVTNAVHTTLSSGTLNLSTGFTSASAQLTNANVTTATIATLLNTNTSTTNVSAGTLNLSTGLTSASAQLSNANVTNATLASVVATTASVGTLVATTITGANASLSGNLTIAGSVIAVNITTTNLIDTNITAAAAQITNANVTTSTIGTLINTNTSTTNVSAASLNASSGVTTTSVLVTNGGLRATFNSNTVGALITTGGNVGIGTTSPNYTLDVAGTIRATTGVSAGQYIVASNSAGALVVGSDVSAINYLSSTQIYISGNRSAAQSCAGVGFQRSGARVDSIGVDTNNNFVVSLQNTTDNLYFKSNTSDYNNTTGGNFLMTLQGNGNVGIGTTSPITSLSINTTSDTPAINTDAFNSLIVSEDMAGSTVRSGTLAASASYSQNTGATSGYVQLTTGASGNFGQWYWNINPGNAFTVDWEVQSIGGADGFSFFWGSSAPPSISVGSNPPVGYSVYFNVYGGSIGLYVDNAQVTAVSTSMVAYSTIWTKARIVFQRNMIRVYYNNALIINYKDTARNYNYNNSFMGFTAWSGGITSIFRVRDVRIQKLTEGVWSYQSQTSGNIGFYGGNVGIGTATPGVSLDVNGTIRATTIQGAGNVGIGTTQPSTGYAATIPNAKLSILSGTVGSFGNASRLSIGADNNHYAAIEGTHIGSGSTTLAFMTCLNASTNSGNPLTRMFIDSSGNVGIGTTSPSTKLYVSGGIFANAFDPITEQGLYLQWNRSNGDGESWIINQKGGGNGNAGIRFGKSDTSSNVTEWMRINDGGNVGIGMAPSYKLDVNGTSRTNNFIVGPVAGLVGGSYYTMVIAPDATNGMNPLLIAAYNDGFYIMNFTSSAGNARGNILGLNSSSVAFNTTSDRRRKTNITDMPSMKEKIKQLRPRTFEWKDTHEPDDGFIAQEIHQVFPQFRAGIQSYCDNCNLSYSDLYHGVTCDCFDFENPLDRNGEPHYYGLDYGKFTPYLTKALQETITDLEAAQAKIEAQQATIDNLQAHVQTLTQFIQGKFPGEFNA